MADHLSRARENVPEANFEQADILEYEPRANTFDGVVCLYTLFHLPRDEHGVVVGRIAEWLKPGGALLVTLGTERGESVDEDWCGAGMAWTSLAPSSYRELFAKAGFEILDDAEQGGPEADEHHWWVLARWEP